MYRRHSSTSVLSHTFPTVTQQKVKDAILKPPWLAFILSCKL